MNPADEQLRDDLGRASVRIERRLAAIERRQDELAAGLAEVHERLPTGARVDRERAAGLREGPHPSPGRRSWPDR